MLSDADHVLVEQSHADVGKTITVSRGAKGGTRTPKAFRLLDPKSSASASSATFALIQRIRGQEGREGLERREGKTLDSSRH
jgi:hypothetical protein